MSALRCCFLASALLIACVLNAHAQSTLRELFLDVGAQHVLPSEGVHSYSEGAPGIVDVRLTQDGSSFVLVGKKPGHTTLLLMLQGGGQTQYKIEVRDPLAPNAANAQNGRVEARDNVRLDFYFVQTIARVRRARRRAVAGELRRRHAQR